MRPTQIQVLMDTAMIFAARSTCDRAHVGVVIAKGGRIISTGYNGAPAGMNHCDHHCDCLVGGSLFKMGEHHPDCNSQQPCRTAVHAEANAIAWAARCGVALEGSELYTTFCPCLACAQVIVNAGITTVHYHTPYRDRSGLNLLISADVEVYCTEDWDVIEYP